MDNINIRFASIYDAAELAKLRLALRSRPEMNIESEGFFLERCKAWITEAIQQNRWRCWVAEENHTLIGALWLQLIEKIPNPTPEPEQYAYITSFFINESARGKGLGSRMLGEAIGWCRERNVDLVILWPRERSRSLYQYHNRNIRVKATMFIGVSRIYVAEDCDPIEALITVVELDESTYLGEQVYENWSTTAGNSGIKKVKAVIEGRFSVISNGCWGPKYKLVATKIVFLSGSFGLSSEAECTKTSADFTDYAEDSEQTFHPGASVEN